MQDGEGEKKAGTSRVRENGNCRELHSLFLCQTLVQQRRRMKKKSPNCLWAIASVTWLPCFNAPWFFKRCQGVAKLSIEIETGLRNCRQHGRSEETFGGALCPFCRNGTLLKIDTVAVSGRLSALIQFSPTHVSWWWWFISCKTWAQNCELGWHYVISTCLSQSFSWKKMSFVFDVHAEPKVVDMTWEGSYMGVLGKNGIVKVGALMFLLLCDFVHWNLLFYFFILVLNRVFGWIA